VLGPSFASACRFHIVRSVEPLRGCYS
jgi:hypothetical protein